MGTVCEGVETAEQAAFLKSVGCERMQGWYFGKPQPFLAFTPSIAMDADAEIESEDERVYWNRVSREDIDTATPWMIVEFKDDGSKVLDVNRSMKKQIDEIHPEGYVAAVNKILKPSNPIRKIIVDVFSLVARTHDSHNIDFIDNDSLILLSVSHIASIGDRDALKVTIKNIHTDLEYRKNYLLGEGLLGLYSQYQLVNLLQPGGDTVTQIYSNAGFAKVYGERGLREGIREFAEKEVCRFDHERYLAFMDMDTLEERMVKAGRHFLAEGFRLREKNGGFHWALVTLLRIPSDDDVKYLYEIQEVSQESIDALESKFGCD